MDKQGEKRAASKRAWHQAHPTKYERHPRKPSVMPEAVRKRRYRLKCWIETNLSPDRPTKYERPSVMPEAVRKRRYRLKCWIETNL